MDTLIQDATPTTLCPACGHVTHSDACVVPVATFTPMLGTSQSLGYTLIASCGCTTFSFPESPSPSPSSGMPSPGVITQDVRDVE